MSNMKSFFLSLFLFTLASTAMAQHSFYDFTMFDIDGNPVNLADYKGKVLLVVNVASECGNTPQYAGLENIYEQYHDQGFEVLGFPANNFGHQEPGTNKQIKEFCTSKYDVTFPMFAKISVKGKDIDPLYIFLTSEADAEVTWNFQKFLIDRNGKVIASFKPGMEPTDEQIINAIEALL